MKKENHQNVRERFEPDSLCISHICRGARVVPHKQLANVSGTISARQREIILLTMPNQNGAPCAAAIIVAAMPKTLPKSSAPQPSGLLSGK